MIFNIDGTLGNTFLICRQTFRQTVKPLVDIPPTDEDITAAFAPKEAGTIQKLAPGSLPERQFVKSLFLDNTPTKKHDFRRAEQ